MGIIERCKKIMEANVNAFLEKYEDPSVMIDQYLDDLNRDFGQVKAETAGVMADAAFARRQVADCEKEIDTCLAYATRAVDCGNDDDARAFLVKKQGLETKLAEYRQALEVAELNVTKMRQMHDKLNSDIAQVTAKRNVLKAKLSVAKTQQRIVDIENGLTGTAEKLNGIGRMETKIDRMLAEADAMAQLQEPEDPTADIMKKYDGVAVDARVEAELAALKAPKEA